MPKNKKNNSNKKKKSSGRKSSSKTKLVVMSRPARYHADTGVKFAPGPSAQALRSRGNVAASICLPHEIPPVRYSSVYSEAPTAIASPFYLNSSDFSKGSPLAQPCVPNGTHVVAVFRDPLRAMVEHQTNPTGKTWMYQAYFVNSTSTVQDHLRVVQDKILDFQEISPLWWDDMHVGSSAYLHPHGNRLYTGHHDGSKGVWVDAAAGAVASMNFVASAGNFTIQTRRLVGAKWVASLNQETSTGSTLSLTLSVSGYYSFAIQLSAVANIDLTCAMSCNSDVMAHKPMPSLMEKQSVLQTVRTNAASLMLSCEASHLNAAGKVVGCQIPAGLEWQAIAFDDDPFSTVGLFGNSKTLILQNGIYGFLKPTSAEDFLMKEPFTISNGNVIGATYNLLPEHDYLLVIATTPQTSDDIFPGGATYTTACWSVEFRTNDVWFVSMPATIKSSVYARDVEALRDVEQWHENPFHFSDIFNFLKGAGRAALKYSPSVLSLLAGLPTPYKPQLTAAAGLAEGARDLFL